MKTGTKGIELIKYFESLHDGDLSKIGLQPKMCPAGVWTEGYGEVIYYKGKQLKGEENKDIAYSLSMIKTEKEAEERLLKSLVSREKYVTKKCRVPLTQNQFDALVSFVYNTGGSQTLFWMINEGIDCENWWTTHYIMAGGKILPGLVKRRETEYKLFTS
jgi:lysozyme